VELESSFDPFQNAYFFRLDEDRFLFCSTGLSECVDSLVLVAEVSIGKIPPSDPGEIW
jgi:hypothetical protein